MYVGTVGGGIWRTASALAEHPSWAPLTDFAPSLSISSLEYDPMDGTYNTLVAALTSYSSLGGFGGEVHGLLRTTNDGNTWKYLDGGGGLLANMSISGVIERGSILVVAIESAPFAPSTLGIYRSTDFGNSFTHISTPSGQPNGIPYGSARALTGDPANPNILYVAYHGGNGATNFGVYKSADLGSNWIKISTPNIDGLLATSGPVSISAGSKGTLYVGAQDSNNGNAVRCFRSGDGGATWSDLGLAQTSEPQSTTVRGGGGGIAVCADPSNPDIVYVGGDNSERCDISQPVGSQWARLAGCISAFPPNSGTINCSGPHEDARKITFDLNGNLILACDGGVFRRTDPQTYLGVWSSINSNLQVGEYHNIAYDPLFQVCMAGTQDCGTQRQVGKGLTLWSQVDCCDGGGLAVDSTTMPGFSIVYASSQGFVGNFTQLIYDSSLGLVTNSPRALIATNGDALQGQFITPFRLNSMNPQRLVIGGANGVYESFNQGNTVSEIGPGLHVEWSGRNGLAYGGSLNGVANPDVLYVAASSGVFVRTNAGSPLVAAASQIPVGNPCDVALVPTNWATVFVQNTHNVYMSTNAGASWTDISGNLVGVGQIWCVRTGPTNCALSVLVGTERGVYVCSSPNFGCWSMVGTNLPNALVLDMEYNQAADLLLVGTWGRGAWMITNAASQVFAPAPLVIGTQPQSQNVPIGATANFDVSVGGTPPFVYEWLKNGAPISAATNRSLLVTVAQPTDDGSYSVVVSNSLNSVTSLVASLTVTGSAPANCALCAPAGLVSWWTADETANDRVGINHGTLQNGISYTNGFIGQAFSLDGIANYVDIPNSPSLTFSPGAPYSLEARVFRTGNQLPFHVLGKRDPSNPNFYQMGYDGSSPSVPMNVWTHLVDTFDGSTYRRYYNGSLAQSYTVTISTSPPPAVDLEIGGSGPYEKFQGLIDEVRIYNRALSALEIQAISNAGSNGMCPPSPLRFTGSPTYSRSNGFVLSASLRSGQSYHLQASTNLANANWITLADFIANTAPVSLFTNNAATNLRQQFYRIISP
jgi:hypothetical protein